MSNLKKHLKKNKIKGYKWAMDKGFGKLNFIYAGIFNGSELLKLKPIEFENCRFQYFEESISNPKNFYKFFELILSNTENERQKDKKHTIEFEHLENLNLNFFKIKNKEILNERFENFDNFMILEPKNFSVPHNDFVYSPLGIFFKAEFLIYEQVYNKITSKFYFLFN